MWSCKEMPLCWNSKVYLMIYEVFPVLVLSSRPIREVEKQFEKAQTIPGTHSMHSYIPTSIDTLRIRRYSDSLEYREERVMNELDIADISGHITCVYNSKWWLACVLETDKENTEVIVMLLHPCRPSRSFKYPSKLDIQILPLNSV